MLASTVGGTSASILNAEAAIKVLENEIESDDADCENCQIMLNAPKHFLPATSNKILGKVVEKDDSGSLITKRSILINIVLDCCGIVI
jgi:hypothetical protein